MTDAVMGQTVNTEVPSQQTTPETPPTTQEYAGFGRRFLAYWVDFLVLFPIGLFIQQIFGTHPFAMFQAQTLQELEQLQQSSASSLSSVLSLAIGLAFFLIMWVNYGATPGKKLLGIKIVKEDGTQLTYSVAFIRYLGYLLSAFVLLLGYLWIIWDKKKQGWHDKLAGTVVVKTDEQPRTFLAVILAILSILLMTGYMAATMYKGFQLGMQEAETEQLTQSEADELAAAVFTHLNEVRAQNNLGTFQEDKQLCAYTKRRLDYLADLGEQDDGRGFYEDVANPQINQAYFDQYVNMGTILFNLNPGIATTPEEVVTSWSGAENSSALSPTYDHACVKANSRFVVLVAGEHR